MTNDQVRASVVAEAMTWIGTPWAHMARLKGVGCDCCNLPIAAYSACGLIAEFDPPPYSRDWHVHMRTELIVPIVLTFGREIEVAAAQAGDLLVFKIGNVFSHCAIVVRPGVQGIHASVRARIVTLCDLDRDHDLITARRRAFTLKGW